MIQLLKALLTNWSNHLFPYSFESPLTFKWVGNISHTEIPEYVAKGYLISAPRMPLKNTEIPLDLTEPLVGLYKAEVDLD